MAGSASAATSGTPRPTNPLGAVGTPASFWKLGRANASLTPPPVAPSPFASSFQVVSLAIVLPARVSVVPPHPIAPGADAGKSTSRAPEVDPSVAPWSPAATRIVIPIVAASSKADSKAERAWAVQVSSGPPQLIEITFG